MSTPNAIPQRLDVEADERALEKRLVRKLDFRIMPILCIAYLLNYVSFTPG